ncbi:hypothetical protein HMPREF9056_02734 [Actinomyces sp. oral taxon 170 str. F0386]|nr:hypothetical protein HMPREF9056_02734 [Actinomyces sp. oral taxon 170 str. F0386]
MARHPDHLPSALLMLSGWMGLSRRTQVSWFIGRLINQRA